MLSTKLKEAAGNSADATLYVDDVFSTYLYTGDGSSAQNINNGIDLAGKGGMVWVKGRSNATTHVIVDTNRFVSSSNIQNLFSDSTAAASASANEFGSFNSNGFSIPYNTTAGWTNFGTRTFASWTFRKAAKFFDVVTYTGTGIARTIAHSLGVAPGMVIVKRTDTTGNWQVYSNGLTSAAYSIQLNLTAAQASAPTVWNSTAPTSSVFSVGTSTDVNASGGTYVAYLYAHDTAADSMIKCGSYTATGLVNLGFEPQYILSRCATTGANWKINDNMRGIIGSTTASLSANTVSAEENSTMNITLAANGFNVNTLQDGAGTYIYMAIRMPNKPPTTGTQVFDPVSRAGTYTVTPITAGFAPDLIVAQVRNLTYGAAWWDRLRGALLQLRSRSTDSEGSSAGSVLSYNNTNVIVGLDGNEYINGVASGNIYANWIFKRAPGFFDEVCYTGDSTTPRNIVHNLSATPELMIIKNRVNNTQEWEVYSAPTGNTNRLWLNSTNAVAGAAVWVSTTPTSSVFTVSNATSVNFAGQTYVAYLFATLAGISKVGSYTGNGTGQAIACGFSAGARFVLIKRTDSTGDWYTFDSARGLTSGSSPYLLLNSTAAEVTGNNGVYASTGGFTLGATAITTTNIATATYIFLAVA
jgi:hypothetical protein